MENFNNLNGVFESIGEDIKKIFLLYGLCCKLTGVSAFRNQHITIDRLYSEFMENLTLKFPEITPSEFKDLYNQIKMFLDNNNIDIIENLWRNEEEIIFNRYKELISKFIINNIKRLNKDQRVALYAFLRANFDAYSLSDDWLNSFKDKLNIFGQIMSIEQDFRDLLIKIGILYKGTWISAKGNDNGISYRFPYYYNILRDDFLKILTICPFCEKKVSPRADKCPKCGDSLVNFIF
ncbi:MAG: hypothetical protein ACTSQG_09740 [Promethearchaeota archaeon]